MNTAASPKKPSKNASKAPEKEDPNQKVKIEKKV